MFMLYPKVGMTRGKSCEKLYVNLNNETNPPRWVFIGVSMKEVMTKIELGGILGKTFGKHHQRLVSNSSEAVRALCCTLEGFEKFLNKSKGKGITFAVFKGKKYW